jgi:large subunit ribosomal protein L4
MPVKASRRARIAALSAKYRDQAVFATEPVRPEEPKTRELAQRLDTMDIADRKVLWLISEPDRNLGLSSRNLANCRTLLATNASVYDIINSDVVLIEKEAIEPLQEMLIR